MGLLPAVGGALQNGFEVGRLPTKTIRLDLKNQLLAGRADGLEAMRQAVYLILNIERYRHLIYSWNYGVELADLFGTATGYAIPEIERRVREALSQDDRVTGVDGFSFETEREIVRARFTVHTIFGDIDTEREVRI